MPFGGGWGAPAPEPDEPDLLSDIRAMLDEGHPLSLAISGAQLVELYTEHPNQMDRGPRASGLGSLLDTFIEVRRVETTALLTACLPFLDDVHATQVARELATRPTFSMPAWVRTIGDVRVTEVWEQSHLLRDGENVAIGFEWGSGHPGTAIVYVDHNMGGVVKDAFVVPETIGRIVELYPQLAEDEYGSQTQLDPAEARARVQKATDKWCRTVPPIESDSWPSCRPLVQRLIDSLPDGYELPEWEPMSADVERELTEAFLASPFAEDLEKDAGLELLVEALLWYGSGYGNCDPLKWSPVRVEILLVDWAPRKLVLHASDAARLPDVLPAFIRFAHDRGGIPEALTTEAIDSIEPWREAYAAAVAAHADDEPSAHAVRLARALLAEDDDLVDEILATEREGATWREHVANELGGMDQLALLDDAPVPDEEFDWSVVPDDLRDVVGQVLEAMDDAAITLMDQEYRTLGRRLLARIVERSPKSFRRGSRIDTWAPAILIVLGQDSGIFKGYGLTQRALLDHLGVKSLNNKTETVRNSAGLNRWQHEVGLLHSSHRRHLLEMLSWED